MMVADPGQRVQAPAGQSAIVLTYPKSILLSVLLEVPLKCIALGSAFDY